LYLGIHEKQLRWLSAKRVLIPLPEEQERQERERLAKEQAQQRMEQLETLLRSQGIDPDQISNP
jgi:DNA-binding protein H-NS